MLHRYHSILCSYLCVHMQRRFICFPFVNSDQLMTKTMTMTIIAIKVTAINNNDNTTVNSDRSNDNGSNNKSNDINDDGTNSHSDENDAWHYKHIFSRSWVFRTKIHVKSFVMRMLILLDRSELLPAEYYERIIANDHPDHHHHHRHHFDTCRYPWSLSSLSLLSSSSSSPFKRPQPLFRSRSAWCLDIA